MLFVCSLPVRVSPAAAASPARARAASRILFGAACSPNRWERQAARANCTMPAAEKKKLVDGELGLTMDPSLLRGATADLLIKNRSEIFSSNVLSQKDLAQLHESTAIVSFLHARRPRPTPSTRPRHSPVAVHTGLLLALLADGAPR